MATGANHNKRHTELVKASVYWLNLHGVYCWPNNTGAAYRNGRPIQYGKTGSTDIMGILNEGRFFGCEVKTGKAVLTKEQKEFKSDIISRNGLWVLVRDTIDCLIQCVELRPYLRGI